MSSSDLDFLDQLHKVHDNFNDLRAYFLMGYNAHEHVCEWFDFECIC